MRKIISSRIVSAAFICIAVFMAITGLRQLGKLEYMELAVYDWLVCLKPKIASSNSDIVIVGISEADIRKYGWPLTDEKLARALTRLSGHEPRAIGVDIYRDMSVPPGTDALESVWRSKTNIIGVMLGFGDADGIPPPFPLGNPVDGKFNMNQVGFNDILVDSGGTVRRGLLFMNDGKQTYPSFALILALNHLHKDGTISQPDPRDPDLILLGRTTIPPLQPDEGGYVRVDARGYQFLIDYNEKIEGFHTILLSDLFDGKVRRDQITDKIVLIGVIAQSVKDIFYTPLSWSRHPEQQLPGVKLHAYMVSQLLRYGHGSGFPIRSLNKGQELLWLLFWCIAGSVVGLWIRSPWLYSISSVAALVALSLITYFSFINTVWMPLVPQAIGYTISAVLVTIGISNWERKQRKLLMRLFSRQLSPEIASEIWRKKEDFSDDNRPRPQSLAVTVLSAKFIKNNAKCEDLNPAYLVEWTNAYIKTAIKIIGQHGGIVDDCGSNQIKVNFGFPISRKTETGIKKDAYNAINCALSIEKAVLRLNPEWTKHGYPPMFVRIGVASGNAFAAALGRKERLKYTTVGTPVDQATMLDSYSEYLFKEDECRTLIDEVAASYIDGQFKLRKLAPAGFENENSAVSIYQVLGHMPPMSQH
jgi:adenylate cyclase